MNPNLSEIMTALLEYVRKLVESETLEDVQQGEQLAKLETLIQENQAYAQERTQLLSQVEELRGLLTQLEQKQPPSEPTPEVPTPETPVEPPVVVEPSPDSPVTGEV